MTAWSSRSKVGSYGKAEELGKLRARHIFMFYSLRSVMCCELRNPNLSGGGRAGHFIVSKVGLKKGRKVKAERVLCLLFLGFSLALADLVRVGWVWPRGASYHLSGFGIGSFFGFKSLPPGGASADLLNGKV